jgi:hypothetical protein
MGRNFVERSAAVARRIFKLCANLARRLVLPSHLSGRQMPMRVAWHAGRIEIGVLVAHGATHGRRAETVAAALDRRLMQPLRVALKWPIAGRMTVHAARRGQHLVGFREQGRRARRRIAQIRKAIRRC